MSEYCPGVVTECSRSCQCSRRDECRNTVGCRQFRWQSVVVSAGGSLRVRRVHVKLHGTGSCRHHLRRLECLFVAAEVEIVSGLLLQRRLAPQVVRQVSSEVAGRPCKFSAATSPSSQSVGGNRLVRTACNIHNIIILVYN